MYYACIWMNSPHNAATSLVLGDARRVCIPTVFSRLFKHAKRSRPSRKDQHTKHHQKGIRIKPNAYTHCTGGLGFVDSGICLGGYFSRDLTTEVQPQTNIPRCVLPNGKLYGLIGYFHAGRLTEGFPTKPTN